jgi:hypothetical protein
MVFQAQLDLLSSDEPVTSQRPVRIPVPSRFVAPVEASPYCQLHEACSPVHYKGCSTMTLRPLSDRQTVDNYTIGYTIESSHMDIADCYL